MSGTLTAGQVAQFAREAEPTVSVLGDLDQASGWPVTGIADDRSAAAGDLSWISPRRLSKDPACAAPFKGSVLICPRGIAGPPAPRSLWISSDNPKLLLIRVADRFFSDLTRVRWGGAPDARLGSGVDLAPGVVLGPRVSIGDGSSVGPNTVLANCTIGRNVSIGANCTFGLPGFGYERGADGVLRRFPHIGGVVIEDDVAIGSNTCIDRGAFGQTVIRKGTKIDNLVHIAHNVDIGSGAMIIANAMLGGSAKVEENAWVAPSVSIMNQITIGAGSILGLGAVVFKDVKPNSIMVGHRATFLKSVKSDAPSA